ncbi:SpaH/EbpB family LPXTG-anchored major pilin [Plantibacter flavus]|uniref:SpaH/EbpB family LPXTG-anchored major pilin n=1 Tax=Plantibacter flavus TaxID=150123 RepID=UPI0014315116|nr:SpaH/EbpB family LPXTG-anchored major pilin [Plantibacter flavus]
MVHTSSGRGTKLAAITAAFLVLGASALVALPASAAPGDAGTGTITVHKLEQRGTSLGPNDGSQLDATGATPLVAGFTVCSVDGLDLTTAASWGYIAGLALSGGTNGAAPVVSENGTALTLSCGVEQETSSTTGETTFAALAADRAYVVYESTLAANAVTASQPTLVTVPYPGNGGVSATWNYNPHIYPKNVVAGSGATKVAEMVGDQIWFEVMLPISPLAGGDQYTEMRINDQLAPSVTYTRGRVQMFAAGTSDVDLISGTHYTLTQPDGSRGAEVVLSFTAAGLELVNANIGGRIYLEIATDAVSSGSTANEATITVNGVSTAPGTGPSVQNPEAFFSGVHVRNVARNKGVTATVPLAGAQFVLYRADDAATSCAATPASDPYQVQVLGTQTSDSSGNTPDAVLAAGKYCVYETVVPAGYKGLAGGMMLTVSGADSSIEVVNTQIGSDVGDLPSLPMTGASGSVIIIVAGSSFLLAGVVLFLLRRRKDQSETGGSMAGQG